MRFSFRFLAVFAVAIAFLMAIRLHAQITTAEVTGTITDASGAVVVGANITVTNSATNTQRTTQTNAAGVYDVPSLAPGTYSIKVEMMGFSTQVRNDILLQVAQVARIDVPLQLGNVSEVVEVTGASAVLETENTAVGTVIEQDRIQDLPLNGRNFLQLSTLAPGATTAQPQNSVVIMREGGSRAQFTLSIGGQRLFYNHYMLDGLENTDPNFQTYMILPSVDALEEFKVESGIFPAEYGHNAIQINVTSRSGSNQFHGALFEFLRNSAFDAKNYFDSHSKPIPGFRRNQFGGVFGGPIVKNKLFFFVNYEGLRQDQAQSFTATLPPTSWLQGNFTSQSSIMYDPLTRVVSSTGVVTASTPFPGNIIPASRFAPQSVTYAALVFPPIASFAANNYPTTPGQPLNNDQGNIRIDYSISPNQSLMGRYSRQTETEYNPQSFPNTGSDTETSTYQYMIGYTWVISPTKVNDLRLGVSHYYNQTAPEQANKEDIAALMGIPNLVPAFPYDWGVPGLALSGGLTGPGSPSDSPFLNYDTIIQSADNFSWNKGDHAFKFGGEVNRTRFNQQGAASPNGTFTFNGQYTNSGLPGASASAANSIGDFLLGDLGGDAWQVGQAAGLERSTYYGMYFQDSWKVTRKLTVNYGLRWEYQQPWTDKYDHIVNLAFNWNNSYQPYYTRAGTGNFFADKVPPPYPAPAAFGPFVRNGMYGTGNIKPDKDNWGPRAGIAYSLNSKTVFRMGGGIYYVHDFQNAQFDTVRNPPFSFRGSQNASASTPNITWANAILDGVPGFYLENQYDEPTTRAYQYSAAVERRLSQTATLEIDFVGSEDAYVERFASYNSSQPGPGNAVAARPFPIFSGTFQDLNSSNHASYDAFFMKFSQRLTHGFTLLSSYTWGKSIDGNSSPRGAPGDTQSPPNPYNCLACERGLSTFDYKMRWTDSLLYNLPFGNGRTYLANAGRATNMLVGGWQAGTIFTWEGGLPDNVTCNNSAVQNNSNTCYPDVVAGISPNGGTGFGSPTAYWNGAAFVDRLPGGAQYRYGDSGRDTLIGPGLVDWDFSMLKNVAITERQSLQLRGEMYNVANHPAFGLPGAQRATATFGVISGPTITNSRQFQVALKYIF
jgi:hypothetical protein